MQKCSPLLLHFYIRLPYEDISCLSATLTCSSKQEDENVPVRLLSECPVNHTCQMHTPRPRHCKTINPSIVTSEFIRFLKVSFIFVLQFQKGYSMPSYELKGLIKGELRYY